MAPNADQNRIRHRFPNRNNDNDDDDASGATTIVAQRIDRLKSIKGTEVVIDGTIYDLASFKHPGGDSVFLFGGNDVTVQYKMIHPYHTGKHLEKMKVTGKVSDMKKDYIFDTPFEREIKREVFKIVRRGREFGTTGYLCRVAFYVSLMATLNYFWTTATPTTLKLAVAFGVAQALIGLNVQHDANHGATSKKPWVNDILGFGADMIGGCKWNWMQQHWTHHAYTNHNEMDPDSFNAEPMLLFNDYPLDHPKRKFMHNFQSMFFLPILSFYWLSMVLNPQTFTLQHEGAKSIGIRMDNDFIMSRRKWSTLIRLFYIYLNIARPIYNGGWSNAATTVFHILAMGCAESLTLATLFSLSHNFETVDRDPTKDKRTSGEPVCWMKSQVETSCTYGGFTAGALTGGLNFQVEHHLFPRMSSAWYPFIAPKVREICKKHNVNYAYYPWVHQNFISTVKYMHAAGTGSNWMTPLKGDL
jgi:fatty acid desaturase (delta-4 desaturase)